MELPQLLVHDSWLAVEKFHDFSMTCTHYFEFPWLYFVCPFSMTFQWLPLQEFFPCFSMTVIFSMPQLWPFIVHIQTQYDRWWKVFTWKSKVSSQLKTSTKRPIWLPRAFTDSVLPVPAGPKHKHTTHVTAASDSTTILNKHTVLKLQQLYNVVQFPCL